MHIYVSYQVRRGTIWCVISHSLRYQFAIYFPILGSVN